jgi:hypothetical protein
LNETRVAEVALIEALTGAVLGAIAMAAVGFMITRNLQKAEVPAAQLGADVLGVRASRHYGTKI